MSNKIKYDYQAAIDALGLPPGQLSGLVLHNELCKMYPDKHKPYPWVRHAYIVAERYNNGELVMRDVLCENKPSTLVEETANILDAVAQQDQLYRTISALFASNKDLQAIIDRQTEELTSLQAERTELLEAIQQLRRYKSLPPPPPDVARAMAVFGS